jgi:hypothetical protein
MSRVSGRNGIIYLRGQEPAAIMSWDISLVTGPRADLGAVMSLARNGVMTLEEIRGELTTGTPDARTLRRILYGPVLRARSLTRAELMSG